MSSEILFMSAYPPSESDLSTYTYNLVKTLRENFSTSFDVSVCALQMYAKEKQNYSGVKYQLDTSASDNLVWFANMMNSDEKVRMIHIQHSFDSFGGDYGENILYFLYSVFKPVMITFHEVVSDPDDKRKAIVKAMCSMSESINVMNNNSADILLKQYDIPLEKIHVIPYGIHPVIWQRREEVKEMNHVKDKIVLSTFGLVCPELNIEYALEALPAIIAKYPKVIYKIIGQTHPITLEEEGEIYREYLMQLVRKSGLERNVEFVNTYLTREEIVGYMMQSDIYISTSRHTYQTVSASLSYALSCGCAIISTSIPNALDVVDHNTSMIIDYRYAHELESAVLKLLEDDAFRTKLCAKAVERSQYASWQNVAIAHAKHYQPGLTGEHLEYSLPEISLEHIVRLTNKFGIIQSSKNCLPDYNSGFTLDDNTQALIAICMHFEITSDRTDLGLLERYISFIENCQKNDGSFICFVNNNNEKNEQLTINKREMNEESFAKAIWALGYLNYNQEILPSFLVKRAETCLLRSMERIKELQSPCAKAYAIKGLWYLIQTEYKSFAGEIIGFLAESLYSVYVINHEKGRKWYSGSLINANCVIPEAMLLAYQLTGKDKFKMISIESFHTLLDEIYYDDQFTAGPGILFQAKEEDGNKPADVASLIIALEKFFVHTGKEMYLNKMKQAFNWFLGNNHLGQMVYNPVTGGCFDGLEFNKVIIDQSAESTVSYLISRVIMERNNSRLMTLQVAAEINSGLKK